MSQLLIKGGKCANPGGVFEADLLIDEGHIIAISQSTPGSADRVIDARGMLVLPSGIDTHVHFPWPTGDFISTDDFFSGTKAAAFGGITTVFDFVIPDPEEGLIQALERKLEVDQKHAWVDFGMHLNVRGEIERKLDDIPELMKRGFPSFKIYMAYEGFRLADDDLLRIMTALGNAGGLLMVHAENGPLTDHLTQELVRNGEVAVSNYPLARPAECEIEAIHRILTYVRLKRVALHVVHVSTAEGAELIGKSRKEGLPVTLECELLDRRKFRTREEAGRAIFEFIEGWYNPYRRHSSFGQVSPVRYEKEYALAALSVS